MRPGPERLRISDKLASMAMEALARCDEVGHLHRGTRQGHAHLPLRADATAARPAGRLDGSGRAARSASTRRGTWSGDTTGCDPASPVLMIGSHLDTVPDAGKYDGVLGVMLGLAAVQALGGRRLPFGIDVIAFSEEEGVRYGVPYLGSLAACGRFDRRLLERTDADGIAMADAFRAFGLDPARIDEAAYPPGGLLGYLEVAHRAGAGARVAGGAGRRGRGDRRARAGSGPRSAAGRDTPGPSPMDGRRDALAAAAELVLEVERLGRSVDGLRATVGTIAVEPGASNVVPGTARLSVDVRHAG